jgi:hypothetical protein
LSDPNLTRIVESWPDLPAHIKAAILALIRTSTRPAFESAFARAFDLLDRKAGSHNFISLAALRPVLPGFEREDFDRGLADPTNSVSPPRKDDTG